MVMELANFFQWLFSSVELCSNCTRYKRVVSFYITLENAHNLGLSALVAALGLLLFCISIANRSNWAAFFSLEEELPMK